MSLSGLSVLIPVYNEEEILVKNTKLLVSFLDTLYTPYEILLCDNGSEDNTPDLAKKLESQFPNKVKFLSISESRSVGFAFREMVKMASFNNLISLDADLSIDFKNFIPRCLELLKENAMVIGSKISGGQKRPLYRKIMSNVFIFFVRLFLGLNFSDYSVGAKGYRKECIIDSLNDINRGTFYVIKLAYRIKHKNMKIAETPVYVYDIRKSRFSILQDAIYRGVTLFIFWVNERLLKNLK